MLQRLIERDLIVRSTQRPREAGTRRRQSLEPELLQSPCAPHVPWVRHHEAAGGVQAPKGGDPVTESLHARDRTQFTRSLHAWRTVIASLRSSAPERSSGAGARNRTADLRITSA